jgi:protein subunit release factor A
MMKLHLEIRPGEGGQDAQLLTTRQAQLYIEHAKRSGIRAKLTSSVG